jgi:zinc transport system permease protein
VAAGLLLGVAPLATALAAAVAGAVILEWLRSKRQTVGDQALALVFYTGIAAGVVIVSSAGALNVDLFAFLFGSILTVTWTDLWVVVGLAAGGLMMLGLLYRALSGVILDEEGARVAGVPVAALNVTVAALAGVTIAVSKRIVGVLMIAALMALPVIAASRIAWSLRSTILLAMAIGVTSVLVGLTVAYYGDLAPGGAIVLVAAGTFVAASLARSRRPA